MAVPAWSAQDFLSAFLRLLPRGRAWSADPNSVEAQSLEPLMPVYQRQAARAAYLLQDAFPVTPIELLPEWEDTLGLPDPCAGPSPSLQVRQQQVAARFVATGGQTTAYFINVAASLGYAITIAEFAPSRFGRAFGQAFANTDWAYTWSVNAPTFSIERFTFGRNQFGTAFSSWSNRVLQCELQRIAPAHTILNFTYIGFYSDGGVLSMLQPAGYPESPGTLGPGALWYNSGIVCVVPGATPNPAAPAVFVDTITPAQLLALGGGDLPLTNPGVGTTQLWNDGGVVAIA